MLTKTGLFTLVIKRSGNKEPFDLAKLERSINLAVKVCGLSKEQEEDLANKLSDEVLTLLAAHVGANGQPTTDQISDAVQTALLKENLKEAAQSFVVYRFLSKSARLAANGNGQGTLFNPPQQVVKRDGTTVPYRREKIIQAIFKAGRATAQLTEEESLKIAKEVEERLSQISTNGAPTVEQIQDIVEVSLMRFGYHETAKSYILYRQKRAEERKKKERVAPADVRQLMATSKKFFRNQLAEFIFYQMYSRWQPEKKRRETWLETVDRFMGFMKENLGSKLTDQEYEGLKEAILKQEVCPSMRLLWSAGPAARRSNVCAYNCSYIAPTKLQDFGEIMYILMCGTGLGFSVEYENVEKLPQIKRQTGEKLPTHLVLDSKEGWADAFVLGLNTWFAGQDIDFDYSKIRPAGARLETMGGRASGPEPLRDLMRFAKEKILARQGRRLRTIDVHDIICKIGEIVVAGGVRRSALISLSNLDDPLLRDAKKSQFYLTEPQRAMANNSAVYETKPTSEEFLEEWLALVKSKSGERGIFNRGGLASQLPQRRWQTFQHIKQPGTNPCGEIILRSKQFCNLTSIVARSEDTLADLEKKIVWATILGTYQATLTHFPYLSREWKENCETEALLGVSITGYYDNALVRRAEVLRRLRELAKKINLEYAKRFGINPSTCITCIKPHGNSSQLLDTASGMHPRFARYYIRRVRISATDPLFQLAKDEGIPFYPEVGQSEDSAYTYVLEFPVKAPEGAITRDQVSAIDLLKEWKKLKENFTEHNPSVTIYIGEDEWLEVANFIYQNWEIVGGLSFLPRTDHVYKLAPYEEISKERYEELMAKIGKIDFSRLYFYEAEDNTQGARELACVSGVCEI